MSSSGGQLGKHKKLPAYERNFEGAALLAHSIRNNNFYVHHKVNVAEGCVWPAFKEAVKAYRGGKEINVHLRDDLNNTSILLDSGSCHDILIPASFNLCHQRFAICKELCHILTDDESVKADDIILQINTAIKTVFRVQNAQQLADQNPFFTSDKLSSEDFCFLLALEILIPIKERDGIMKNQAIGVKTYDTACGLRIPETLVKFFINSGYNQHYKRVVSKLKLL